MLFFTRYADILKKPCCIRLAREIRKLTPEATRLLIVSDFFSGANGVYIIQNIAAHVNVFPY
jgi:hypothetical protein